MSHLKSGNYTGVATSSANTYHFKFTKLYIYDTVNYNSLKANDFKGNNIIKERRNSDIGKMIFVNTRCLHLGLLFP